MEDRAAGLVGHKVAVSLNNVEARGVEIIGTLDEARDDGILLSEIGELGPGPTMFLPWDSLRHVRERPWWLRPPHEEPVPDEPTREYYEPREAPAEERVPEPPVEQLRAASARSLERVVPIAQKRTVGGITVALASLELFGEGLGVLRYRLSYEKDMCEGGYGIPGPVFEIRAGSGRTLSWSPQGSGSSGSEADGEVEIRELPEAGELEVEVARVVSLIFDEEMGDDRAGEYCSGPWTFRFTI